MKLLITQQKKLNNKTIDSEIIDDDSDEDNGYDSDNENDS